MRNTIKTINRTCFKFETLTAFLALNIFGLALNVFSFENFMPDYSISYALPNMTPIYDTATRQAITGMNLDFKGLYITTGQIINTDVMHGINRFLSKTGLTKHTDLKKRLYNKYVSIISEKTNENTFYSPFMMMKIEALKGTHLQQPLEQLVTDFFPALTNDKSYKDIMMEMQKELINYIDSIKVSYLLNNQLNISLMRMTAFETSA